ncbi:MAG: VCBS repeat-containing protein [Algibacter sp.]
MSKIKFFKLGINKGAILIVFIVLIVLSAILIASIFSKREKQAYLENQYNINCGSCHLTPNPANIPRALWKSKVLPEMERRMGLKNYLDGSLRYSDIEKYHRKLNNAYPEKPLLDSLKWQQISNYILSMAPEKVPNIPARKGRNSLLTQFKSSFITLNDVKPKGGIVNVKFDDKTNALMVGDVYGQLHELKNQSDVKLTLKSPIVSSIVVDSTLYVTEIGIMNPSEVAKGVIYAVKSDTIIPIAEELHRPVYIEVIDLNDDGNNEVIVCEFGHLTGALSLLVKEGEAFKKKMLLKLPGSAKLEIVDMNGDGKKDIVVLFAQGREGIYIFYQKEHLEFNIEQVIMMQPEYGSSWFSLLDYNNDGHLDILLANGDNADYSIFLKPYHGVRLFINNGDNEFNEEWFYPINGATRVLVEDFDLDGDLDFAVLSFFPDFNDCPEEGFVYLENKDAANYTFTPYITKVAKSGNWLVMEKGDFDEDGDVDIVLGNFSVFRSNGFKTKEKRDLLYLENEAIKK